VLYKAQNTSYFTFISHISKLKWTIQIVKYDLHKIQVYQIEKFYPRKLHYMVACFVKVILVFSRGCLLVRTKLVYSTYIALEHTGLSFIKAGA
jgi:hypothetical protein